jgi:hypothetical protein
VYIPAKQDSKFDIRLLPHKRLIVLLAKAQVSRPFVTSSTDLNTPQAPVHKIGHAALKLETKSKFEKLAN